jgi:L-asparaginase II
MTVRYALMTVAVVRGGIEESRHQVHVAVCRPDGTLVASAGDPTRLTTMRSAAKPFQAHPMVASGALDAFGMDDEVLAVCCASHMGADAHAAAVRRGLAAAGLTEDLLQNTLGTTDERVRHNCSGNHLAFLAHSVHEGWPVHGYRDPNHPSQIAALDQIARSARVEREDIGTCVDGCGVVCFALPLMTIAGMYGRLAGEVPRQAAAMRAHPEMVRGPAELDTEVMRAVRGAISKAGAEALTCISLPDQELGVAIRVEDGAWRAVEPAVVSVLQQLFGWDIVPSELARFRRPVMRNSPGDIVGFVEASVPLATVS